MRAHASSPCASPRSAGAFAMRPRSPSPPRKHARRASMPDASCGTMIRRRRATAARRGRFTPLLRAARGRPSRQRAERSRWTPPVPVKAHVSSRKDSPPRRRTPLRRPRERPARVAGRIASNRTGYAMSNMLLWFERRRLIVVNNAGLGAANSTDAGRADGGASEEERRTIPGRDAKDIGRRRRRGGGALRGGACVTSGGERLGRAQRPHAGRAHRAQPRCARCARAVRHAALW